MSRPVRCERSHPSPPNQFRVSLAAQQKIKEPTKSTPPSHGVIHPTSVPEGDNCLSATVPGSSQDATCLDFAANSLCSSSPRTFRWAYLDQLRENHNTNPPAKCQRIHVVVVFHSLRSISSSKRGDQGHRRFFQSDGLQPTSDDLQPNSVLGNNVLLFYCFFDVLEFTSFLTCTA